MSVQITQSNILDLMRLELSPGENEKAAAFEVRKAVWCGVIKPEQQESATSISSDQLYSLIMTHLMLVQDFGTNSKVAEKVQELAKIEDLNERESKTVVLYTECLAQAKLEGSLKAYGIDTSKFSSLRENSTLVEPHERFLEAREVYEQLIIRGMNEPHARYYNVERIMYAALSQCQVILEDVGIPIDYYGLNGVRACYMKSHLQSCGRRGDFWKELKRRSSDDSKPIWGKVVREEFLED